MIPMAFQFSGLLEKFHDHNEYPEKKTLSFGIQSAAELLNQKYYNSGRFHILSDRKLWLLEFVKNQSMIRREMYGSDSETV